MTIAKDLKKKIDKAYVATGIMGMKLPDYLADGRIESGGEEIAKPIQSSISDDKTFGVFVYKDNSMLIVQEFECLSGIKD